MWRTLTSKCFWPSQSCGPQIFREKSSIALCSSRFRARCARVSSQPFAHLQFTMAHAWQLTIRIRVATWSLTTWCLRWWSWQTTLLDGTPQGFATKRCHHWNFRTMIFSKADQIIVSVCRLDMILLPTRRRPRRYHPSHQSIILFFKMNSIGLVFRGMNNNAPFTTSLILNSNSMSWSLATLMLARQAWFEALLKVVPTSRARKLPPIRQPQCRNSGSTKLSFKMVHTFQFLCTTARTRVILVQSINFSETCTASLSSATSLTFNRFVTYQNGSHRSSTRLMWH